MPPQGTAKRRHMPVADNESPVPNRFRSLYPHHTYDPVFIVFPEKRVVPKYCTYEGVLRCGICRVLWTSKHRTVCPERIQPRDDIDDFQRCQKCMMPLQRLATQRKRHLDRECLGEDAQHVWQPAWDGTLHCPHCHLPGWTTARLMAHLTKPCSGDRNKEIRARDISLHRNMKACGDCGIEFHQALFADHLCGLPFDTVWLGQALPDSLAISYLDYVSQIQPPHGPCGFGGVHLGPDAGGAIQAKDRTPKQLIAESYGVPWSVRDDWNSGPAGEIMHLMQQLSRAILYEARLVDPDGDAADPDTVSAIITERIDEIVVATKDLELPKKQEQLRIYYEDIIEKKNHRLCQKHYISLGTVLPAPCPGFVWKHGWSPCPFGSQLTLRTIRLQDIHNTIQIRPICYRCHIAAFEIRKWILRGKYDATGQRLCPRPDCRNLVVNAVDCEEHAQLRLEQRLKGALRRVQSKKEAKNVVTKGLWKVLSPGDMTTFLGEAVLSEKPGWKRHSPWATVAASMSSDDYEGPKVFFFDTETILRKGEGPCILSIAIIDAKGHLVLNEKVDYKKSIQELTEGIEERMIAYAMRIYGATTAAAYTNGIPPAELRQKITKDIGLTPECILIEWSVSGWDWRALKALFDEGEDLLPATYTRGPDLPRAVGYHGPQNLMTLFSLLWPTSGMINTHHDADIDTIKLYAVVFSFLFGGSQELPDCIKLQLKLGHRSPQQAPLLPQGEDEEYEDEEDDFDDDEDDDDLYSEYVYSSDGDDEEDEDEYLPSSRKRTRK